MTPPNAQNSPSERRIRVLFVANDPLDGAVTRYRCENFSATLPPERFDCTVVWVGDTRVAVNHDIVVLHRICTVLEGRQFANAARACGAVLVYGADDLVFDPTLVPPSPTGQDRERMRRYAPLHTAMLRQADAVLVSTDFLAERAQQLGGPDKPVFVLRNFLSDSLLALSAAASAKKNGHPITFGYLSGSATHHADLAFIAKPLVAVLGKCPDAELIVVGPVLLPPALTALGDTKVRRLPFVPWRELPRLIAEEVTINLAPLDLSDTLVHGKSEIKLLEAAAVGVPTVASASAGFHEALAVSGGQGGWLAATDDEWQQALLTLATDPDARRAAGWQAREYLSAWGSQAAHRQTVEAVFDAIAALPVAKPPRPRTTTVGSPLAPKFLLRSALRWMARRR